MNFDISQVADLLGLERQYPGEPIRESYNVRCPLCDRGKSQYRLNINTIKGVWRCSKCGVSGGTLDLYTVFGLQRTCTKESRRLAAAEIKKLLNLSISKKSNSTNYVNTSCYLKTSDYTTLSDTELDKVYSALLNLPVLRLHNQHYEQLISRGLSKESINQNCYKTLPDRLYLPKGREQTMNEFRQEQLDVLYRENPRLKRMGLRNIVSGICVALYLENLGISVQNVPGFFKVNGIWCFTYTPGIIIPVRNHCKEIVGLQIRTSSKKCKYITVSSRGYDCGVSGMCRVHYPLFNPRISDKTVIRLTEGPLKADTALNLTPDNNVAYISISGINATKDLETELDYLKSQGCKNIFNALDMDKITNPNVMKGSVKIKQIVHDAGLKHCQMFWDEKTAISVYQNQRAILNDHEIHPEYIVDNIFYQVYQNTKALAELNILFEHEWPNAQAKGIDDFLQYKVTQSLC